jgi:hypothetical protein
LKKYLERKMEKAIRSLRPFFSAAQVGARRMAVGINIGDYATWVIVGVDCLLDSEDPMHRHADLEEEEAMALAICHSAERPLAKKHGGNHSPHG